MNRFSHIIKKDTDGMLSNSVKFYVETEKEDKK